MKKIFSLIVCCILLFGNVAFGASTTTKKLNQYNSKGQKIGYIKTYTKNNEIKKIEKYNTKGKRIEVYR